MCARPFSLFIVVVSIALTGCGSPPTPAYRRIDAAAPDFKAAIARETAVEQSKGRSVAEAERIAARRVTSQAIAAEKQRRTDSVAPLNAALDALNRPRGCWAYTVTTTTRKPERTTVEVERFDPFHPEERIWTLLRHDERPPTDDEQANYRRARLRKWKAQQTRAAQRKPSTERTNRAALYAELDVTRDEAGGPAIYTFIRDPQHVALLGDLPRSRETYVIGDSADRVLRHSKTHLGPFSVVGGSVTLETFDQATDYIVIQPALAPFPAKSTVRVHLRAFGIDSGEVTVETLYSDYRRVKCYDDRFEVQIGIPSVQDYLPGSGR